MRLLMLAVVAVCSLLVAAESASAHGGRTVVVRRGFGRREVIVNRGPVVVDRGFHRGSVVIDRSFHGGARVFQDQFGRTFIVP